MTNKVRDEEGEEEEEEDKEEGKKKKDKNKKEQNLSGPKSTSGYFTCFYL